MKINIKSFDAVAAWKWNIKPGKEGETQEEDEEDDVCGICQNAFEGCCTKCKVPGDDCPLSKPMFCYSRDMCDKLIRPCNNSLW